MNATTEDIRKVCESITAVGKIVETLLTRIERLEKPIVSLNLAVAKKLKLTQTRGNDQYLEYGNGCIKAYFDTDDGDAMWALKRLIKEKEWNYEIRGYWPGPVVCQIFRHVSDLSDHQMFAEGRATEHNLALAICKAIEIC